MTVCYHDRLVDRLFCCVYFCCNFSCIHSCEVLYHVVEHDSLCQDIYQVYWRHLVKSFGTVGKETTEAESALLLYMAQHFASAGNTSKILLTI